MTDRPHGSYVKYKVEHCRCEPCTAANSEYVRARATAIEPAYVSAGPARDHVRVLAEHGVGLKQIARAAGVSHGALSKLVYGDRTRGTAPSKRIRKSTLDKILSVTPANAADGSKQPAAPTWALIDQMTAAGVPKTAIARELGQTGPLQLSRGLVSARNARAVADIHRRWLTGDITFQRRDRWGNTVAISPPPSEHRPAADISDLVLELAEILEERTDRPWRADAACRNRPVHLWFPARGDRITQSKALSICGACIVRDQCRAANLDKHEGIYGGLTPNRRRQLRRELAA